MIFESILAGLAAGAVGAMVGIGGGVIMVPILTLVLGLPLATAIPASLVGVVATAVGGTGIHLRDGRTDPTMAIRAAGVAMIGAIAGAKSSVYFPASVLFLMFAVLLVVISIRMLMGRNDSDAPSPRNSPVLAGGIFAVAGFLAGLLGIGGGILNVPALRIVLRRGMLQAAATSIMIAAFTAATAAAAYASAGQVVWPVAAGCATGAFTGGRVGALIAPRVPRRTLQLIFVVILIYVAVEMMVRGLGLKWWR